jgi:hypothetical protein
MLDNTVQQPASRAAREALFRVQVPNSSARDILVIPLDEVSAPLVSAVAEQPWRNARFVSYTPFGEAWRAALDGKDVDLVVMIGQAGENLSQAIAVGETCLSRQIKISGVLVRNLSGNLANVSASLRSMRPWTQTLAVITDADYLPGLLHALGA